MIDVYRTPDERFSGLTGYPFAPRYVEWDGLRMHYVDVGNGAPVLLLHGEPTWSYLYREIIPPLVAAGYRCIAPDYVGFGKSDKLLDDIWYTAERHSASVRYLIESLRLQGVTLVVHDWGGPIGLRQVADMPERFRRLFILNTWLHHDGYVYGEAIRRWRQFATGFGPGTGDLPCGYIVSNQLDLPAERKEAVAQAYDAPFPTPESKAGPRRFPWMLPFAQPVERNAEDQARCFDALRDWHGPAHFIFGKRDTIFTVDWAHDWAARFPGVVTIDPVAGPHFPQEESPTVIASLMLKYMRVS